MNQRSNPLAVDLNSIFGADAAPLALRVLTVVDTNASRAIETLELLEAANIESSMDGLLVLAVLTRHGLLARAGAGVYASTVDGLRVIAAARAA